MSAEDKEVTEIWNKYAFPNLQRLFGTSVEQVPNLIAGEARVEEADVQRLGLAGLGLDIAGRSTTSSADISSVTHMGTTRAFIGLVLN